MASPSQQLTRLLNNAKISLPGSLEATIKLELWNVMDEFLKDSDLWRVDVQFGIAMTNVTNGDTAYEIEPDENGAINRFHYILDANDLDVPASMATPGVIVLNTAPSVAQTLTATVSLTCVDPATQDSFPDVPDWIVIQFYPDLLEGILARMMAQPAKPYTSERLAIYHMRRFKNAIAKAKIFAQRKNIHGAQAWHFPAFA